MIQLHPPRGILDVLKAHFIKVLKSLQDNYRAEEFLISDWTLCFQTNLRQKFFHVDLSIVFLWGQIYSGSNFHNIKQTQEILLKYWCNFPGAKPVIQNFTFVFSKSWVENLSQILKYGIQTSFWGSGMDVCEKYKMGEVKRLIINHWNSEEKVGYFLLQEESKWKSTSSVLVRKWNLKRTGKFSVENHEIPRDLSGLVRPF